MIDEQSIRIICAACHHKMRVQPAAVARRIRCPNANCRATLVIPAASDADAEPQPRKRTWVWASGLAAVVAIAVLIGVVSCQGPVNPTRAADKPVLSLPQVADNTPAPQERPTEAERPTPPAAPPPPAAKPEGPIPDTVRKLAVARHADAVPVRLIVQVKEDGTTAEEQYTFLSASSGNHVMVGPYLGKLMVGVEPAVGSLKPLPSPIAPLKESLAAARKEGLVAGFNGPILASLAEENGKSVWRFHGADKAGTFVSIAIGSAPPDPDADLNSGERIEATPQNIARVLKKHVGPDAAGVAVKVVKPNNYSMQLTLTGKVPHPGVKMLIRRAISRWTDVPGSPEYDDSAVIAPGRPGLVNAFNPSGGIMHLSQNGSRLAVVAGSRPERIDVWDTAARRVVQSHRAPTFAANQLTSFPHIALSADGGTAAALASTSDVSAVLIFGDAAKPVVIDKQLSLNGLAVAAGGKAAAIGAVSGPLFLIKNGAATELPAKPANPGACRWLLAFSPDGKQLAVGETDADAITVWDVATGKQTHRLGREQLSVTALAWSGDGRRLAVGSHDGDGIVVFDPVGGTAKVLAGMPGKVRTLSLSPDGSRIASFHFAGGVGLWDVTSGKLINALDETTAGEHFAGLADGGKALLTGIVNKSGEVRRWDISGGTADNAVPAGGATAIRGVTGKIDLAGDLLVSVEYRITGAAGKDCTIVVALKDAAGKAIPSRNPAYRTLTVTAVVRPESDTESAYRVLRVNRSEVPAGAMTAEVNIASGGRWLLDQPHLAEVKSK